MATVRTVLPGFAALVAVAGVAHGVATQFPLVSPLVLSVGLGAVVANAVDLPPRLDDGIAQHDLLLETAIVLLGASVPLAAVAGAGATVVVLVLATVAAGILLVELLARVVFSLGGAEGSLVAAGASICGVSAVVAVARSIDADRETLSYVSGAVLLFDAVTLLTFPAVGGFLGLPDRVFGVWAGLAMFSTGPVAAAGFAISAEAGQWATITKLVRNALIGVVAVGYAVVYARYDNDHVGAGTGVRSVWSQFPKFLVGFLAVAAVANAGLLSPATLAAIGTATDWLFALAFAGVGFTIRLERMRAAGYGPVAVLAVYLVVVSLATLLAVVALL